MGKFITGIGGVFFKSKNPGETKNWYSENLGLDIDEYGTTFKSRDINNPDQTNYLQWSPMNSDTDYFDPSENEFMINYRVNNLDDLIAHLKSKGISIIGEVQVYDYGKFAHILDNEGRKIEFWEPVDKVFDEYYSDKE